MILPWMCRLQQRSEEGMLCNVLEAGTVGGGKEGNGLDERRLGANFQEALKIKVQLTRRENLMYNE